MNIRGIRSLPGAFPWIPALLLALGFLPAIGLGDVIHRSGGGKVTGTILPAESTAEKVFIQTRAGKISVSRSEIESIETTDAEVPSYEAAAAKYPQTADGQYDLALWCQDNKFPAEYRKHLQRVIELAPDHAEARKRLGFELVNGRWITHEERLESQGYVKHNGKYVLPQEKKQSEQADAGRKAVQEYYRKARVWQKQLRQSDPNKQGTARKDILAIRDPLAVKPLVDVLGDKGNDAERRLLVEALANIPGPGSTEGLLLVALNDPAPTNRQAAAVSLKPRKSAELVQRVAGVMRENKNVRVRSAAKLLGDIGDATVVPSLIDALITVHETIIEPTFMDQVARANSSSTQLKAVYTQAGAGMRVNHVPVNNGPIGERVVITEEIRNAEALEALAALTGQNLGYDKARWFAWFQNNEKSKAEKATDSR